MWQYHTHGTGDGGAGDGRDASLLGIVDIGERIGERAVEGSGLRGLAGEDGPVRIRRFEGAKGGKSGV